MAARTKDTLLYYQDIDAGFQSVGARLRMSVTVEAGTHPVVVKGFGINEARFRTLQEVYDLFCCPFADIRLDNGGCDLIAECLTELGFVPPRPY